MAGSCRPNQSTRLLPGEPAGSGSGVEQSGGVCAAYSEDFGWNRLSNFGVRSKPSPGSGADTTAGALGYKNLQHPQSDEQDTGHCFSPCSKPVMTKVAAGADANRKGTDTQKTDNKSGE